MDRTQPTEEQRDSEISKKAEAAYAEWRELVEKDDPRAVTDLQNTVLERLSAEQSKAIFAAALLGRDIGDALFAATVQRAMHDQCEVEAIKQVEQIEARRAEDQRAQRIERRVFDRLFGALA